VATVKIRYRCRNCGAKFEVELTDVEDISNVYNRVKQELGGQSSYPMTLHICEEHDTGDETGVSDPIAIIKVEE